MSTEKPEECECCGFKTSALKEYQSLKNFPLDEKKWQCELCAGTMTGSFSDYPKQHDPDTLCVMKTICYVGNAILAEIKKT
jgi:hypothetical protein